jgi:putative colanic acid biosynthesis acetyltransferase WcaF
VMVETGNHDWSKPTFDLLVKEVVIEDGAWAAVRSLLLPGARLASHAVLGAGSVLSGDTEPYGIYVGVPATRVRERVIGPEAR